jgi:hypothetical protein
VNAEPASGQPPHVGERALLGHPLEQRLDHPLLAIAGRCPGLGTTAAHIRQGRDAIQPLPAGREVTALIAVRLPNVDGHATDCIGHDLEAGEVQQAHVVDADAGQ